MPKSYQCGRWVGFGGWMGVVVWVVGAQDFHVSPWHFENGASSKNDDVLAEDGGLLQVLPLAVHPKKNLTDKYGGPFWTIIIF